MEMTVSTIIQRLQANQPSFKQLILTAHEIGIEQPPTNGNGSANNNDTHRATRSNLPQLLQALQANTTVHSVFLDHFFVLGLADQELISLLQALGSLPKLEHFAAVSRQAEGWCLPLPALTALLEKSRRLTSLRLTAMALCASGEQVFQKFAQTLQTTPLHDFCLRGTCVVNGRVPLDTLLPTLAGVSSLEKIELTAMELQPSISIVNDGHGDDNDDSNNDDSNDDTIMAKNNSPTKAALSFCHSSSLKSLELGGWALEEAVVVQMATALETNFSLKSLILLDSHINDIGCNALANMLRVNTTLQRLDLSYNAITPRGAHALVHSLRTNTSLKELGLFGNFASSSCHHYESENDSDSSFSGSDAKTQCRKLFLQLLQHYNFHLEDLLLDSDFDAEMNFYLTLNRLGRDSLLRNEHQLDRNEWVQALAVVQGGGRLSSSSMACDASCPDHLSYLYYYIQSHPHFLTQPSC